MKPKLVVFQVFWIEQSFLIAAEKSFTFEVIIAGSSLQKVKSFIDFDVLAIGHSRDMLECYEHVLLHNYLLSEVQLIIKMPSTTSH